MRNIPLLRPVRYPVAELIGNVGEDSPADRKLVPIKTEESDCPLRLLKRLDQPVQQNAIKAAIAQIGYCLCGARRTCSWNPPVWSDTRSITP